VFSYTFEFVDNSTGNELVVNLKFEVCIKVSLAFNVTEIGLFYTVDISLVPSTVPLRVIGIIIISTIRFV